MKPQPVKQDQDEAPGAWLSALVDGHGAAEAACSRWRDDEAVRRDWHAYHLIGDVMRSDELASRPGRDAAFLLALRAKLAEEPVVLAPTRRRHAWMVPVAAAAGFAVVAGVVVVTRLGQATAGDAPGALVVQDTPVRGTRVETPTAMVRDAALDQYLRAHRQFGAGVAISTPGYPLRNADYVVTQPAR